MISVDSAIRIIHENGYTPGPVQVPLTEAEGMVLAEGIFAPIDIPAFPQSSMDGYAFSYHNWEKGSRLRISGEMAAGSSEAKELLPGHAVRIFTGAAVPQGADTVLMQEKARVEHDELVVEDENLQLGDNVRAKGSETKKDVLALPQGSLLTPPAIGYLAGLGFNSLPVFPSPKVGIIVTGNELQVPGQLLQYGQVYESNSFSLAAALKQCGITELRRYHCGDNEDALSNLIKESLRRNDLVLLTGGVSVGDYDFTLRAAGLCGVETLFHKIKQKPGKPIFVGKKGHKLVFGLPGNPASVLTCFYMYVIPVIEQFTGKKSIVKKTHAVSGSQVNKPAGITWFLKGQYEAGVAKVLDAQESYRLSSFARANCLIKMDEDQTLCRPGDPVSIYVLPA